MFKKINIDLTGLSASAGDQEIIKYGLDTDKGFEGIKYNDCNPLLSGLQPILDKIPAEHRSKFFPLYMTINRDIIPHIDSGVMTVINIYIEAGGYKTDLNTPKDGAQPFQIPNQTNGTCYQFEDVNTVDSYVANNGEIYILDVSKLHSVHSGTGTRTAVALSTNIEFNDVVEMFVTN